MLIPVKPSKALVRSSKRKPVTREQDVRLEVIPFRGGETKKVGKAKVTGRTAAINRKGP